MRATKKAVDPLAAFNQVLAHTTVEYLDRARAHPFVKWAGGKRTAIPEIVKVLPNTFGRYWEPFVGGGAVFFALDSRIRSASLSDVNLDLVLAYKMIQTRLDDVIQALQGHARKHSRAHYLRVRNRMHGEQDAVLLAARFLYLNRTCYNGLYRVNRSGRFNVPFGQYKNPMICDVENLTAASAVLSKATVQAQPFTAVAPKRGDLVYCDPPYDGTFTGYTGDGFTADDQKTLRDCCVQWRDKGANVVISNSDTDLVRRLYKSFTLHTVSAPCNINSDVNGRGKKPELLIVG